MSTGKKYGPSALTYIRAAGTFTEAERRLHAALTDYPNASSGTRRKWAKAVEQKRGGQR